MSERERCLVTGASGYIGGRLVPELLAAGYQVRCMARDPAKLRDRPWSGEVEVARADAQDAAAVAAALDGVDVAYYLIHSMGTAAEFEQQDRDAATVFAKAAAQAGVGRIVYLGGIVPSSGHDGLSPHLRSRGEVGEILLDSGVPTAVLQAAVIIGSGSASFEMLRYLTERLPVMVTPRWVRTLIQPIAVRDVLKYLTGCAALPPEVSRRFDIGGPDVLTYADMMERYAAVAGLKRRILIQVPLLSPGLSSHWVGLVTPVPAGLARPLVESLRNEVVCSEHDIAQYIPDPPGGLVSLDRAIELALRRVQSGDVATRWTSASTAGAPSDLLPSGLLPSGLLPSGLLPSDPHPTDPQWSGGSLYTDDRARRVHASPELLWRTIEGIGGERGWYSFPLAWWFRGLLDRAVGGVGLRRGRRDPDRLQVGDALDFWRVEEIVPGSLLRLRAEMKLPGRAWLEFAIESGGAGGAGGTGKAGGGGGGGGAGGGAASPVLRQTAIFLPRGLFGHLYWWALRPFHGVVFGDMYRRIAAAAGRATLASEG
ncbi:MAG TPA: SDR family oxidoreductase [Streptosporangiaceae bacterium]